jgi:hypothetical protein
MLTYADLSMLTYADVCQVLVHLPGAKTNTVAKDLLRMLAYADVC